MSGEALSREQRAALDTLAGIGIGEQFYLAGGAALALRLGHRQSVDLDFFSRTDFPTRPLREKLERLSTFRTDEEREGTLNATLAGIPVSFLAYPYPLLAPTEALIPGVPVASLLDVGAMKLSAIVSRGIRRDFIDVYTICKNGIPLKDLVGAFQQKAGAKYNPHILGKALVYFVDAEKDPMPALLKPVDWDALKAFFMAEATRMFS